MNIEEKLCPQCKMSLGSHSKQDLRDCIALMCECGCHDHQGEKEDLIASCTGCDCYKNLK